MLHRDDLRFLRALEGGGGADGGHPKLPSLRSLIVACEVYELLRQRRRDNPGKPLQLSQIAGEVGFRSSRSLYKLLGELEARLHVSLFRSKRGSGTETTKSDDQFFTEVKNLLAPLRHLVAAEWPLEIAISTTDVLGTRLVAPLLRRYFDHSSSSTDPPERVRPIRPRIEHLEPYDIATAAGESDDWDIALTYCPADARIEGIRDGDEFRVPLPRCLLISNGHPLAIDKHDTESAIRDGRFPFRALGNVTLALPEDARLLPGLPWQHLISSAQSVIRTGGFLESHACVRGSGRHSHFFASVSYRPILSEEEEKTVTAIDLSECPDMGRSDLVLMRPPRTRSRRSEHDAPLIDALYEIMKDGLGRFSHQATMARDLNDQFRRYRSASFTTTDFLHADGDVAKRWFHGAMAIDLTPKQFIRGSFHYQRPSHPLGETRIELVGRIRSNQMAVDRLGYHLLCRATGEGGGDDELSSLNFVFLRDQLIRNEWLVGTWIGRFRWTPPGDYRPGAGMAVLHNRPIDGGDSLQDLEAELTRVCEAYLRENPLLRLGDLPTSTTA